MSRVPILNAAFDALDFEAVIDRCIGLVRSGDRGYLCTVNVAILMMMNDDPRLQTFVDRASIIVADGEPIIWLSRALGTPLPERVTGVDLIQGLVARAKQENLSIYLLGAEPGVAEQVANRLETQHAGLRIAGVADGYFSANEAKTRAERVRASGADILFLAMGVPRQERFLEEQWETLGVPFAMPVGGTFDVLAGLRKRAPRFVQRAGMEWMFRLAQEPKRLWKRYLVTNTQFLAKATPLVAERTIARLRGERVSKP